MNDLVAQKYNNYQDWIGKSWRQRIELRWLIVEKSAALWERQIIYWESLKQSSVSEEQYTPEEWKQLIQLRASVALFAARLWEKDIKQLEDLAQQKKIGRATRLRQWIASYNALSQSCYQYNLSLAAAARTSSAQASYEICCSQEQSEQAAEILLGQDYQEIFLNEVHPSTKNRLLTLLQGDADAASRLLSRSRTLNPTRAEQWHYQSIINELLTDRQWMN